MPEITRFYGIIIKIFLTREHNPPHFHAVYNEHNAEISIETGDMIEGDLPAKAQELIKEWWSVHKDEIAEMWDTKTLKKLPPLN
ncbi:MAG: DUF4160 domain-containing protein [Bacteroides sp.]|nr:DUF4160 domain-containing protein [Eubacterium sp.]MCM1463754.1 DUF4160 domain-containing protein [Bacteroides sp.]